MKWPVSEVYVNVKCNLIEFKSEPGVFLSTGLGRKSTRAARVIAVIKC